MGFSFPLMCLIQTFLISIWTQGSLLCLTAFPTYSTIEVFSHHLLGVHLFPKSVLNISFRKVPICESICIPSDSEEIPVEFYMFSRKILSSTKKPGDSEKFLLGTLFVWEFWELWFLTRLIKPEAKSNSVCVGCILQVKGRGGDGEKGKEKSRRKKSQTILV